MSFLKAPEQSANIPDWCRRIAKVVNSVMDGKTNNTGTLTLTASSTTTTVTFIAGQIGNDTVLLLSPTTANAAGALSSLYISGRDVAAKTITLTHANTAAADKTFSFVLVG